ncbi:hypothetical protein F5Y10DRAFT_223460 [Nemania abortiva]|nr:hypothetical protein F5Y10DRAFT_223460 [Nemania abortiva]
MSVHPDRTGPTGNDNGNNTGYYAELPADVPQTRPAQTQTQSQSQPHPAAAGGDISGVSHELAGSQDYFPPPPPGPPPVSQNQKQEEPYFPPPPPGPPPPTIGYSHDDGQQHQYYYPPPPPGPPPGLTSDAPPPSYAEEFGDGPAWDPDAKTHLPPPPPSAIPPALPPRPVSSGMTFAPPPTSASQGGGSSTTSGGGSGGGGFGEKLYRWGIKAGAPVNRIANRLGAEAFWPMTLDLECEKAARILKSFCKDGFYTTAAANKDKNKNDNHPPSPQFPPSSTKPPSRPPSSPSTPSKVLVKIPPSVLAAAKGLAIFTTFRTGLHISGAGGSGIVVARLPDGSWSPPAGFLVHTLGAGLMVGIDVYDCVCVLTTQSAVDAFARRARVSLGGEIAVVAGPVGVGGALEGVLNAGKGHGSNASSGAGTGTPGESTSHENKPVWSYMKSRGFYAGVQADGTVIIPRMDANAAFYGERGITVEQILKGQVKEHPVGAGGEGKGKDGGIVMWPEGGRQLTEVLKSIEGKRADEHVLRNLDNAPTPGDLAPPPDGGKA